MLPRQDGQNEDKCEGGKSSDLKSRSKGERKKDWIEKFAVIKK
jgi:hypothetical protein